MPHPLVILVKKHGNKVYVQVLLDPNRAAMLKEMADKCGDSIAHYARSCLYWHMEDMEPELYDKALQADVDLQVQRRKRRSADAKERMRLAQEANARLGGTAPSGCEEMQQGAGLPYLAESSDAAV